VLLQYLIDEHGDITPLDLQAHAKYLDKAIQTLYSRIKDIQTYAQASIRTFTDQHIVDAVYTIINKTGVYYDDCDDWLETTPQPQTWTNFQKHFNAAHRKAKRKQRTTQSEGYHSANAALQNNNHLQAKNKATTKALANMATAMLVDHTTMGQLTNAIADPPQNSAHMPKRLQHSKSD
jgi:hypothetical protein